MRLNFTKLKLAFATIALAFVTFISVPNSSAQASSLLNGVTQNEQAQPLEMRYHRGYRGHRGFGRRHFAPRRHYRPRPHYGYGAYYAPRPVHCRIVVRYDRWGYPRRIRRCF